MPCDICGCNMAVQWARMASAAVQPGLEMPSSESKRPHQAGRCVLSAGSGVAAGAPVVQGRAAGGAICCAAGAGAPRSRLGACSRQVGRRGVGAGGCARELPYRAGPRVAHCPQSGRLPVCLRLCLYVSGRARLTCYQQADGTCGHIPPTGRGFRTAQFGGFVGLPSNWYPQMRGLPPHLLVLV